LEQLEQHILLNNYLIKGKTSVKPINDVYSNGKFRSSEDSIFINNDDCIVGLADGAGGTGVFAKEWGEFLISNLPKSPIKSIKDVDNFIDKHWNYFYDDHSEISDTFLKSKFEIEGSSATMFAIWFTNKELNLFSYGDAIAFKWNYKNKDFQVFSSLKDINELNSNPYLINWKTESHDESGLYTDSITLQKDEVLLIASDAFAAHIWSSYLSLHSSGVHSNKIATLIQNFSINNFDHFIDELNNIIDNQDLFEKYCKNQVEADTLWNDDCSLLIIQQI